MTVVGARPQFVKAAPVSRVLQEAGCREILVHTGQHYDHEMSGQLWAELGLPRPAYNLACGSGLHGAQTARMLEALEGVMRAECPERVVVYGDTNSTLAGALAASKLHVPIVHVEAGLRSFNRAMPEEVNRLVADVLSTLLCAPTESARKNLLREGIADDRIVVTGDVMYDAALQLADKARASDIVERLGLEAGRYVLATIHRVENTDDPAVLRTIVEGFQEVSKNYAVVWPLHPRTRRAIDMAGISTAELRVISPVGILEMIRLEASAAIIATDSGGVQKEAFFYRVPCVTLRAETEWLELVEAGWNRVVRPTDSRTIAGAIETMVGTVGRNVSPFGSGDAADRIVKAIVGMDRGY